MIEFQKTKLLINFDNKEEARVIFDFLVSLGYKTTERKTVLEKMSSTVNDLGYKSFKLYPNEKKIYRIKRRTHDIGEKFYIGKDFISEFIDSTTFGKFKKRERLI